MDVRSPTEAEREMDDGVVVFVCILICVGCYWNWRGDMIEIVVPSITCMLRWLV